MVLHQLARDRPEDAERELLDRLGRWRHGDIGFITFYAYVGRIWIKLYREDAASAWDLVSEFWAQYRHKYHFRVQTIRGYLFHLRGCSALAAAGSAGDRSRLLRIVRSSARALHREGARWAQAHGRSLSAALADAHGRRDEAIAGMFEAMAAYEAVDMRLYAAVCRRRLGDWIGGERGHRLRSEADSWMSGQGICRPEAMAHTLAPILEAR
jgi:hypothetical protein